MYECTDRDMELVCTATLRVWITRPTASHRNWWLRFYSTQQCEVDAWNETIEELCYPTAFHQSAHELEHRRTDDCVQHPYTCPGTVQGWEMFGRGCGEAALVLDTIADIRGYGDEPLEWLLALFPAIRARAEVLS